MIQKVAFLRSLIRSSGSASFSKIGGYCSTRAASSVQSACEQPAYSSGSEDECPEIDWNNLGFTTVPTDYMYITKCSQDGRFEQGQLNPYGNLELHPSACVLNYGQGLFEGLKAFKREDGRIFLFRPDQNAIRMQIGAERMCMPSPSVDQFIHAVNQTALANKRWIPPQAKGSLYVRPLLIGTGPVLGIAPAQEYTFLVYASPVGNYFKAGLAPLNLYVEEEFHRAAPGGAGGVKAISNYAPSLKALIRARSRGFSDVLYLDSVRKRNLEEATASNVFIVKGDVISTPSTSGTILAGITRRSVIDVAQEQGYKVEERTVSLDELFDADEVFCTGTAVVLNSVGSVTYQGKRFEYKTDGRLVSQKLYSTLMGIQTGEIEDKNGWMLHVE